MATGSVTPGVVVAMRRELRILERAWRGQEPPVSNMTLSGVGPQRAAVAAEALIRSGSHGLVSIGLAGGLDPSLRCGDVLVPRQLRRTDGPWASVDGRWRDALLDALAAHVPVHDGDLVSVSKVVSTARGKAQLAQHSGAAAVDMEAAAVAAVAARHGRAMLAVKVIVDTREHSLPAALDRALDEFGSVRPGVLGRALLGSPALLLGLPGLARAARVAEAALYALAARAGPGLRLPQDGIAPGEGRGMLLDPAAGGGAPAP